MTSLSPSVAATDHPIDTDADGLLKTPAVHLDALFQNSPAGRIPRGRGAGTVILAPGSALAIPAARVLGAIFWKGKVFRPDSHDLKNKITPLGVPAIRAQVDVGDSWLDGRPCVVLDYSKSSKVAGWIRDEIREVAPGRYLGLVWGVGRFFGGRKLITRRGSSRRTPRARSGGTSAATAPTSSFAS